MLGFLQDDWNSIAATIDYAIDLGSTFAQFKMLTPYPGTPMFKQLDPLLTETDWEKFDGFTPTFKHPNLTDRELRFLLGAAYTRYYMRPSYLANFLKIQNARDPRMGQPDGSPRQRPALARRDRRHLTSRGMLNRRSNARARGARNRHRFHAARGLPRPGRSQVVVVQVILLRRC